MVDLDGFKAINDTFGHHVGDLLLHEVARRMRAALRASDTVARLGGDEFAALLPTTDAAAAARLADTLRQAVEAPLTLAGQVVQVGASVGSAVYSDQGYDAAALLRAADAAMYTAKHGRAPRVAPGPASRRRTWRP
jgi:diguanylate cyclase (GGDEF)-like protein